MTPGDPTTHSRGSSAIAAAEPGTSQLMQISRAMVRIYKEQFGRGPEHARSYYAGPDAIVCFLENTLTPVERSLTTLDQHQRLRDMRMLFQYAAEAQFRSVIQEVTGRRVVAFISGIDTRADVACELFQLEPSPRADGHEQAHRGNNNAHLDPSITRE
jgi:uncharacterized protein YbcI